MASCDCGNYVDADGKECEMCFVERFVSDTLPLGLVRNNLRRIEVIMAGLEQYIGRAAFEEHNPRLYKTTQHR